MRPLIRPLRVRRLLVPIVILSGIAVCLWIFSDTSTEQISQKRLSFPDLKIVKTLSLPTTLVASNITTTSTTSTTSPLLQLRPPEKSRGSLITKEEISGGEPAQNATLVMIRDQIRQMTKHAWDSYVKHAWGFNELKPVSKSGHQPSVLGSVPLGATIVDSLDTLYIMGLRDEFNVARKYVAEELDFDKSTEVSVFEFTIRYLGGLLTAYTFTLDDVFLNKAVELARRLLPAFETPTGIPMSLINLKTAQCRMFSWSRKRCAILSEAGTLHMEFKYLSELTGDPVYASKVDQIRKALIAIPRPDGLFFNYVDYRRPEWCSRVAGLGALADSFYEYLLKEWIRTDHADVEALAVYNSSVEALYANGLFKRSPGGHLFVGTYSEGTVSNVMEHLTCFAGGMLALGAQGPQDPWFRRAVELAQTCNLNYESSPLHLGSENFEFADGVEAIPVKTGHKFYLQRPETVETYFYLWRLTKNEDYRTAALKVVQALEKHARTDAGFAGLKNVFSSAPQYDDVQQSYFLAETLKYLYLIFSEDSLLPLDRWVFNSEGHPFPIHNHLFLGHGIWPKAPITVRHQPH